MTGQATCAPETDEDPIIVSVDRPYLTDREMKAKFRENLLSALDASEWRISGNDGAAELLGMKPSTLTDRMRSMGIKRPAH
jgi:transcriptional regulator with GAF, ATPase, and Fis domain